MKTVQVFFDILDDFFSSEYPEVMRQDYLGCNIFERVMGFGVELVVLFHYSSEYV